MKILLMIITCIYLLWKITEYAFVYTQEIEYEGFITYSDDYCINNDKTIDSDINKLLNIQILNVSVSIAGIITVSYDKEGTVLTVQ